MCDSQALHVCIDVIRQSFIAGGYKSPRCYVAILSLLSLRLLNVITFPMAYSSVSERGVAMPKTISSHIFLSLSLTHAHARTHTHAHMLALRRKHFYDLHPYILKIANTVTWDVVIGVSIIDVSGLS